MMKNSILFLILLLIQQNAVSQGNYERITIFAGCMIKSLNSSNLGNTVDGDLRAYPETIEWLLQKFPSLRIVIPGHGQPGGLELIEHTKHLLNN